MLNILYKYHFNFLLKRLLIVFSFLLLLIPPLFGINFTGNTGYSIPIGNWATHHNSAPFISFGTDLIKKDYLSCGIGFDVSSFPGKLNSNYNLQIFSLGTGTKFYPLFFVKNHNLFINSILSYGFMEKKLRNAIEKGRDFSISTLIGAELKISENWLISSSFGEKHFAGGIDVLIFAVGLEFRK